MTTPIPPMHFVGLEVHALDGSGAPTVVDRWFLRSFQLQETVSEPFSLRVSLSTDEVDLRVPAIVGGRARFRSDAAPSSVKSTASSSMRRRSGSSTAGCA